LELFIGNLIVRFISMIFWVSLLNCIIGKVYLRLKVGDVELVGGCADVSLLIPIGASYSVEIGYHHVVPYVEFTVVVEEGTVYVHLYDVCSLALLAMP
jgi:hypothetical protein